ncbi:MAG: efflux RND transporter periplasmic adaptor subunit [Stellaceae bacterium]
MAARACILVLLLAALLPASAQAQKFGGGPPAVGVTTVAREPVRPSLQFVGRIQAIERVNIAARVTAFIQERLFTEGAEVKKGDLLYRLEQAPFQADVAAKQAAVDQFQAQLQNANVSLYRQKALLRTPAGQQSNVDAALANQLAIKAQLEGAQAMLRQSQINLAYTEIRAPIDGKIGRTAATPGNVVSPSSGTLATIVSQDPMYVVFPVPVRTVLDLRQRLGGEGGFGAAVAKIQLPNGGTYKETGKLDFVDNTVNTTTDTIDVRAVMPNPVLAFAAPGSALKRELVDNEIVTVILEETKPVEALTVPRQAVLADQQGEYVYVVAANDVAQQRRITLGQSTPTTAVVAKGLSGGEKVIVEGLQRVRPGEKVAPGPATPPAVPENAATDPPGH